MARGGSITAAVALGRALRQEDPDEDGDDVDDELERLLARPTDPMPGRSVCRRGSASRWVFEEAAFFDRNYEKESRAPDGTICPAVQSAAVSDDLYHLRQKLDELVGK